MPVTTQDIKNFKFFLAIHRGFREQIKYDETDLEPSLWQTIEQTNKECGYAY